MSAATIGRSGPQGVAQLELERTFDDGRRERIALGPPAIYRASMALDAGELVLHGSHHDGRSLVLTLRPREDGVVVSLTRAGERRWLARRGDETRLDDGLPRRAIVPRTWGSSVLSLATLSAGWPATFPWHDDLFSPIHALSLDACAFERCTAAPDAAVDALVPAIRAHLAASDTPWRAVAEVIAELRRVGHDLWSLDDHGSHQIWGADYMRRAEGQGLYLELGQEAPFRVMAAFGTAEKEEPR